MLFIYVRKFMLSERGRKADTPRYNLLLTDRKIMEKFFSFSLFLSPLFLSLFIF